MKRLGIACLLSIFLIFLCLFGTYMSETVSARISEKIQTISQTMDKGDFALAQEASQQLQKEWEGYHTILCTFLCHKELEGIDEHLAALPRYLETGEKGLAEATCAQIEDAMKHLKETEELRLENIL